MEYSMLSALRVILLLYFKPVQKVNVGAQLVSVLPVITPSTFCILNSSKKSKVKQRFPACDFTFYGLLLWWCLGYRQKVKSKK